MKFRDESELAAWSSAWDAAAGCSFIDTPAACTEWADTKIEAMRERMPELDRLPGEPGPFSQTVNLEQSLNQLRAKPQRSERGALERVATELRTFRAGIEARKDRTPWQEGRISAVTDAILAIDAELARQPADELPEKVGAVVWAARIVRAEWEGDAGGRAEMVVALHDLVAAVKALDGGGE